MGRKSSIKQLDPRIREAVDRAIRDGRATIDELVELVDDHGAKVSRPAMGRYAKNAREQMKRFQECQEIAKLWIRRLEEDPEGDVGRLITEMLRTVAFQTIGELGDSDAGASAQELFFLGKAIKEMAQADKIAADREIKVRQQVTRKAAETAEKSATAAGMSADTVAKIKREILGIA